MYCVCEFHNGWNICDYISAVATFYAQFMDCFGSKRLLYDCVPSGFFCCFWYIYLSFNVKSKFRDLYVTPFNLPCPSLPSSSSLPLPFPLPFPLPSPSPLLQI